MFEVSSNTATFPPTYTFSGLSAVARGMASSRKRSRRAEVRASWGAVVGIAKIVAISPSSLGVAGATLSMPGVFATASCSFFSCASFSGAPFGMSTASRNGPLEPGPNARLSWS